MGSIDWADVLRGALSFFLIAVGVGIAYLCFRIGGMFGRMSVSVVRVTDEVVPILNRAQTTVDGINLELARVDEIMVSAVNATKGAEKTVTSLSNAVTAPVRKASGVAAAAKEAMATFKARRAAGPDRAPDVVPPVPSVSTAVPSVTQEPVEASPRTSIEDAFERVRQRLAPEKSPATGTGSDEGVGASPAPKDDPFAGHFASAGRVNGSSGRHETVTAGASASRRGPSLSQITWALPKRHK